MTLVKQPALSLTIPIKVFRDPGKVGIFYSSVLNQAYSWTSRSTPSGEVMWNSDETNKTAQELTEITYEALPATLYDTIKLFYIGKPKTAYREIVDTPPNVRSNY
jgi:hypothetical protein